MPRRPRQPPHQHRRRPARGGRAGPYRCVRRRASCLHAPRGRNCRATARMGRWGPLPRLISSELSGLTAPPSTRDLAFAVFMATPIVTKLAPAPGMKNFMDVLREAEKCGAVHECWGLQCSGRRQRSRWWSRMLWTSSTTTASCWWRTTTSSSMELRRSRWTRAPHRTPGVRPLVYTGVTSAPAAGVGRVCFQLLRLGRPCGLRPKL